MSDWHLVLARTNVIYHQCPIACQRCCGARCALVTVAGREVVVGPIPWLHRLVVAALLMHEDDVACAPTPDASVTEQPSGAGRASRASRTRKSRHAGCLAAARTGGGSPSFTAFSTKCDAHLRAPARHHYKKQGECRQLFEHATCRPPIWPRKFTHKYTSPWHVAACI